MAAGVEDSSSMQADNLPTGSISFGRFEHEQLSWERWSSFSHNRYLEEVEKYSKSGSVTQKKAYFEAHFKKKALERQTSSLKHESNDCQTAEDGIQDYGSYYEEYGEQVTEGRHEFGSSCATVSVANEQEHDVLESTDEQLHFSWDDDTPPAISDEDYDVIESNEGQLPFELYGEAIAVSDDCQSEIIDHQEETDNPFIEVPEEHLPCIDTKALNYSSGILEHTEVKQRVPIYDTKQSEIDEVIVVVEEKNEDLPINASELPEDCDILSTNSLTEKDNATCSKKLQKNNVKSTMGQKSLKVKLQKPFPTVHTARKDSSEEKSLSSVKAVDRVLRKAEKENTLRTKTEKQSCLKVPPSTYFDSKTLELKTAVTLAKPSKPQSNSTGPGGQATSRGNSQSSKATTSNKAVVSNHASKNLEPRGISRASQSCRVEAASREKVKPTARQLRGDNEAKKGEGGDVVGRRVMKGIVGRSAAVHVAS